MFRERVNLFQSKSSGTRLDFVPDAQINWMIRNIDTEGAAALEFYNSSSTLSIEIDREVNGLHLKNQIFHCSPTIYYRVLNLSSSSKYLTGDGYVSRESSQGDTLVQNIEAKANGQYLEIRPSGEEEWSIHTVMSNGAFELYKTNGVTSILSERVLSQKSALTGLHLYCTNSVYWKIKQIDTGTVNMGFDGIRTK